jgi:hypothetical protein
MPVKVRIACFAKYHAGLLSLLACAVAFFHPKAQVAVNSSTSNSQISLGKSMFCRIIAGDGSSLTFGPPGAVHA